MTLQHRFFFRMVVFLVAVGAVALALYPALHRAFLVNPALNGLIVGVILIGIALDMRQVLMLAPESRWVEGFRRGQPSSVENERLRLLAPMARALSEQRNGRDRLSLSTTATRSLLDSISSRLEESRDISRYFVGLCIFLGLLGTFWGLLETVSSIGEVIQGLTVNADDMPGLFNNLKHGLDAPLKGMSTAFSSSLLGLSGSLVLGFLDLQASQAQNNFYNELEDWLAGQTRLGAGGPVSDGETSMPAYIQALLEQTAESLSELQNTLARGEESRVATNTHIRAFADRVSTLTDQMRAEQALLQKIAESQIEMKPILARLAEAGAQPGLGGDDVTRIHIRNIDTSLARLVEESTPGRERAVKEIRSEIKLLARTIAALAEEGESPP
ncbi:MAG: MotA/TolQ/ExbB proton channel family protein [Alphaproteobacteria bacterium]|nr:MotA/TolQ/ExbB proton channel family protein [Alphaproteobacteria bacterium]MBF0129725.1 MotA/TolQ/ExbB proton channel family protein [Alphaproteobacteria bacterium]